MKCANYQIRLLGEMLPSLLMLPCVRCLSACKKMFYILLAVIKWKAMKTGMKKIKPIDLENQTEA